jgi:hypothetical protein
MQEFGVLHRAMGILFVMASKSPPRPRRGKSSSTDRSRAKRQPPATQRAANTNASEQTASQRPGTEVWSVAHGYEWRNEEQDIPPRRGSG